MKTLFLMVAISVSIFILLDRLGERHPITCDEYSVVTRILSVEYRESTVQLANGKTKTQYQATVKPGDLMCMKWSQK